jgi:virulence factor Mce-like protein
MSRLRPRRTNRRYDHEPPMRVLGRGLVVSALIVAFGWLATTFYSGVPFRDYEYVQASVPRIGSLLENDPVRIGGVRVGQVKAIGLGPEGASELVLQLEPGTDIPADTKIRIRASGLLGARFVELVPGTERTLLAEGESIRGGDDALTFGATDALDTFDDETRGALRPLLGELGSGLAGRGRDVNDTLRIGAREIGPTTELFGTLNDSADAVDRLLPSLRAGVEPLDRNRGALTRLLRPADRALQPFVDERDATRAALTEAPSTLAAGNAGLSAARPLLVAARSLAGEARTTLPGTPAALRATAALLRESDQPLDRADRLLKRAATTVPEALRLTGALQPVLTPLAEMLDEVTPMVRKVAPYGCDIKNFGAVFRSMTGFGTRAGGGPNGPAMQFRLQAASPLPEEALSLQDTSASIVRDGYPTPCKYLAKPYPIIERPQLPGAGR